MTVDFQAQTSFKELFPKLDAHDLIEEWSFTVCSLEEVFLRVADGSGKQATADTKENGWKPDLSVTKAKNRRVTLAKQVVALVKRRATHLRRSWLTIFFQMIMPVLYFGLLMVVFGTFLSDDPPLDLSLERSRARLQSCGDGWRDGGRRPRLAWVLW